MEYSKKLEEVVEFCRYYGLEYNIKEGYFISYLTHLNEIYIKKVIRGEHLSYYIFPPCYGNLYYKYTIKILFSDYIGLDYANWDTFLCTVKYYEVKLFNKVLF